MDAYSILLECSEETLPKACGHVLRYETKHVRVLQVSDMPVEQHLETEGDSCRTPILDVVVEAMLSRSARQQCAAVGMVSFLLLGCGGLQDSSLLFATFQDMLPWKQTIPLSLQSCCTLLRHDEPQVPIHSSQTDNNSSSATKTRAPTPLRTQRTPYSSAMRCLR